MRKAMLIFGIIAFLCIVGLVIADVNSTQTSAEQDKLNPLMRAYINYEYDSTVSNLNNSTQSAVTSIDASKFTVPVSGSNSIVAHTDDPNANLAVVNSGSSITIRDNSSYKYLFNVQMNYTDIESFVRENKVRMVHINDVGNVDAEWYQDVQDVNGYVYFNNLPFTGVTITSYGVAYAYVPAKDDNSVHIINLATYTAIGKLYLPSGSGPLGVAVNHAGTYAYIADSASSKITAINTANNAMTTTTVFSGSGTPLGITLSNDDSKLFVTNFKSNVMGVYSVSGGSLSLLSTVTVGSGTSCPSSVIINHAGTKAYVSNTIGGTVAIVDTSSYSVATIPATSLGGNTMFLNSTAISPDDSKLYVSAYTHVYGQNDYVYSVSTTSPYNRVSSVVVSDPSQLAISSDGSKVYATQYDNDYVSIITVNPSTGALTLSKYLHTYFSGNIGETGTEGIWVEPTYSSGGNPPAVDARVFFVGHANGHMGSIWVNNDSFTMHNVTLGSDGSSLYAVYAFGTPQRPTLGPGASFSQSTSSVNTGVAVTFTDTSYGNPTHLHWVFGDGATADTYVAGGSTTHSYSSAGTYTTSVTAYNAAGYSTSDTQSVAVTQPVYSPVASFTPTSHVDGVLNPVYGVSFDGTGSTNMASGDTISWNFGDGTSVVSGVFGTYKTTWHNYQVEGTFTVTCTVTNSAGTNTMTKTGLVSTWITPIMDMSGSPRHGSKPLTVQFTDSCSHNPTSWYWDFGDGSTSTERNPSHTYSNNGVTTNYQIYHTATNYAGTAYVTAGNYITAYTLPNAGFTANVQSGTGSLPVQFTDQSTNNPTWWSWTFGDGATSNQQSPQHTYTSSGTYNVVLTVGNDAGQTTCTKNGYISVGSAVVAPVANFAASTTQGGSPLAVHFTDSSSNGPTSYSWNFGDSGTSTIANPDHTYQNAGTYTVSLTVSNSAGSNTKTNNNYIIVATIPVASFTVNATSGATPLGIQFTDTSDYTNSNMLANFGFESGYPATPIVNNANYALTTSYYKTGTHSFCIVPLTTSDPYVDFYNVATLSTNTQYVISAWVYCESDTYVSNPIFLEGSGVNGYQAVGNGWNNPQIHISANTWTHITYYGTTPSNWYGLTNVRLRGAYTSGGTPDTSKNVFWDDIQICPATWAWNFGDGGTSTLKNPIYAYNTPGIYTVSLTESTIGGSGSTTSANSVIAVAMPTTSFTSNQTAGIPPTTIQFNDTTDYGGDNKIVNGDIEADLPGNLYQGYATGIQTTAQAHTGSHSLSVISTSSSQGASCVTSTTIPQLSPSTQYYWEAWVYSPVSVTISPSNMVLMENGGGWRSIAGGSINGNSADQTLPAGVWTKISGTGSTQSDWGSGTVGATILLLRPAGTYGAWDTIHTIYYDDIKVYPSSWSWDFGDGNTSTQKNPAHTYSTVGKYNVSFTASNTVGSNTITRNNYITAAPLTITPVVSNLAGWNFEDWTNGTTNQASDGWIRESSTGMSRSSDAKVGSYSIMFTGDGSSQWTGLVRQHLTGLTPGYYTLGCWLKSNGVGNGTLECGITNTTTWSGTFPWLSISNGTGDNQWHYVTSRQYISDVGSDVYLSLDIDSYPSSGFRGYIDGITLTPDMPQIAVTESSISHDLYQSFSYTPAGSYAHSVVMTKYNNYNLSDPTRYTVIDCTSVANAEERPTYIDSNGNVYIDMSGVAATEYTIGVDTSFNTPTPTTDFTANNTLGGTPLTVHFTDTSTNNPTAWQWSWGDSTANGTDRNPIHTYAVAGLYTVTLTGLNDGGSSTVSKSNYIHVVDPPVAGFTKNTTMGSQPLCVQFTDNSTHSPTSYHWDFGDGGISTVQNPVYTYTNAGTYTVTHSATNNGGTSTYSSSNCINVISTAVHTQAYAYIPNYGNDSVAVVDLPSFAISKYITVGTQPYGVAVTNDGTKAYVTNYNGGAGSTVSVIDTASGTISTSINVGNGAQGIIVTPDNNKIYVANNASNTVTVINGTTNTVTSTIAGFNGPSGIAVSPDGTKVYVANGGVSGNNAGAVSVINTASDLVTTVVPSSVFGGSTPMLRGIATAPDGIKYYVASRGNNNVYSVWTINNTVAGVASVSSPNQLTTNLNGSRIYATTFGGSSLIAINNTTMATVSTTAIGSNSGTEGIMVDPFGIYTYVIGRSSNTLYYLYTDNNTFVGANVTGLITPYAYGAITRPIATISPPVSAFIANVTAGDIPLTVKFTDNSLNVPNQWYWTFGDGTVSSDQNPTHIYTNAGAYNVTLTTRNVAGSDMVSNGYYITTTTPTIPVANFTASPTYGGIPLTVHFTDTSTNNPRSWSWNFGDGNTSVEQNPTHTYTSDSAFEVRLTATNGAGSNIRDIARYITAVSNAPHTEFFGGPTYGNAPFSVQFNDTSVNGPTSWAWNFGDGGTSTVQNATHTYTKAGAYTVTLTTSNDNGADQAYLSSYITVSSLTAPTYGYVPNYGSGTVSVINLAGANIIKTIPVGTNPFGVSVNSVGTEAYITNYNNGGASTVSIINTTENNVTNTLNVGYGAYGVAITPDCTKAYVANSVSNTVSVIDAVSHTVVNTIYGFNQPIGVVIDPSGSRVYVSNDVGTISVVSTVTDQITDNISADTFGGGSPVLRGLAVSTDGKLLYVASSGNNKIYAIWTDNYTAACNVHADNANCLALTPSGNTLYSSSYKGTTLQATNLTSVSPSAMLPLGVASDIEGVTADPNGQFVYVFGAASNTMYYVYINNNTIAGTLSGFSKPYAFGNIMRQSLTPPTKPHAEFGVDRTYAWIGYPIHFTDLSAGIPTSWHWDFGDGNTSSLESPVHAYSNNAIYNVTLEAQNDFGTDNATKGYYIYIDDASSPGADFTATPTFGYTPLTVQFNDNSTNNPRGWQWTFGDGGGSTEQNPKHTYTTADAYTVSLTTENAAGYSTKTIDYYITVSAPVVPTSANFTATPTSGAAPLTVYFTDTSIGTPTSWAWDFGDGSTSNFMNPSHTYTATGAYTVSLTTMNAGGISTAKQDYYIRIMPPTGLPPHAAFSADVTSGVVPFAVQFTDKSTGEVNAWHWDFGDGSTSNDQYPTHTYTTVGSYTVSLTASNTSTGLSNITTASNYIYASSTGGHPVPLPPNPAPLSGFTADVTTGHTPFVVHFTDLSSNSPTNWTWVFGDGGTSTDENPAHTYSVAGKYDVTLVTVNPYGTNTVTKPSYISSTNAYDSTVPVTQAPVASFTKSDTGTTVTFNDTSTSNPTSWAWDFGDGTTSTEQSPVHQYEKGGDYAVMLTVSNNYGSSVYTMNTSETPQNYSQYVGKLFTKNMSGFDFLSHTVDFYTSFMPAWLFWCVLLLIPFISMYNRQGGIILVGVLYLVTGGILSTVMPTVLGGAAFWFFVLGFAGILYKLFIPD